MLPYAEIEGLLAVPTILPWSDPATRAYALQTPRSAHPLHGPSVVEKSTNNDPLERAADSTTSP